MSTDKRAERLHQHVHRSAPVPPPLADDEDFGIADAPLGPAAPAAGPVVRKYLPGLAALRDYRRSWWRADAFAGLAVAAYLIPQVLAYAGLLGVPAVAALWTALAALVVYAFLGSSRHLSVGPEATVALLAGSIVGPMSHGHPARAAVLASALALIVAGWLLVARLARLGVVSDLLSHPLLVGYLTGAGVLMIAGQLGRFTGADVGGDTVLGQLRSFARHLDQVNGATVAVSGGTLAVLLLARWLRPTAPAPLIAVVTATIVSAVFDLRSHGVAVLGHVPAGLPAPGWPAVGMADLRSLVVPGLGLAVVAFSDNMLIGRAFARRGDHFDGNAELVALAGVHAAAGLMHGFPVSSSGSRTALAISSRARSQAYSLVAAVIVLAVLVFAGPVLTTLPMAALAAVVVYAAFHLIDLGEYRWLWGFRRSEFAIAVLTCAGTLAFGILTGVGIAIALSVVEMVARLSRPPDAIQGLVPGLAGMHDVDDYPDAQTIPGLVVYRYDAPLFFVNAEDFRQQAMDAVAEYSRGSQPVRWLVLNVEANMHIDVTAARSIARLHRDLCALGIKLGLVRVKHDLAVQLERAGLLTLIPPDMLFPTLPTMLEAYRQRCTDRPGDAA